MKSSQHPIKLTQECEKGANHAHPALEAGGADDVADVVREKEREETEGEGGILYTSYNIITVTCS